MRCFIFSVDDVSSGVSVHSVLGLHRNSRPSLSVSSQGLIFLLKIKNFKAKAKLTGN